VTKDKEEHNYRKIFNFSLLSGRHDFGAWYFMLAITLGLILLVYAGWYFGWNREVVAGSVLLVGAASNVFAWLLGLIGMLPLVGPIIVKVLSFSVIWLLNAVGYLVSYIAIKRGYSKDVLTYRGLTIALIVGIVIGYILGNIF